MDEHEVSTEQEVDEVSVTKPHVIILGAGASRATCPSGDKNGKQLPLMRDFVEVLGLGNLLSNLGINPSANFEDTFNDLYKNGDILKTEKLQDSIIKYFADLCLPDYPTAYDHLVLSLRGTDLIATFNWDPLLMQAYLRNCHIGLSLPKLSFLHGNISVGYCAEHKVAGLSGRKCRKCGKSYTSAPLLYPIKQKNYSQDLFIANEWKHLHWGLKNAFMVTVFGYSAPKTDVEAIAAMKAAWGDTDKRQFEQLEFITDRPKGEISKAWKPFIHTHHYAVCDKFYNSWIANHPRRTGEAWWNQYFEAKFISNNPAPKGGSLQEMRQWYLRFRNSESKAKKLP